MPSPERRLRAFGAAVQVTSFFLNDTATTEIYTLSLHDALPISTWAGASTSATIRSIGVPACARSATSRTASRIDDRSSRSEEHTSELQSRRDLVCRLLLEKKK